MFWTSFCVICLCIPPAPGSVSLLGILNLWFKRIYPKFFLVAGPGTTVHTHCPSFLSPIPLCPICHRIFLCQGACVPHVPYSRHMPLLNLKLNIFAVLSLQSPNNMNPERSQKSSESVGTVGCYKSPFLRIASLKAFILVLYWQEFDFLFFVIFRVRSYFTFLEWYTENTKTKKFTIWAVLLQLWSLDLLHGKLLTLISWQTGKKWM